MKRYQTSILNLKDQSISQIDKKIKIFKNKYQESVKEDGIIWILSNSVTEKGKFYHTPFYIAEQFNELFLKNIIIAPSFLKNNGEAIFKNYVTNILFLSKNEKYYFDKDPIREKHIWKNVEWGKRKKNYNPKGKDQVSNMIKVASLTRKGFMAGDISTVMSPRTVLHWAENSEIFKDIGYAFRVTFLNKCDDAEKNTIAEYYQRCFGEELPESMINIQI